MAATIDEMNEGIERRTCWNEESKRFMAKVMEVSGLGPSTFLPDGAPRARAAQPACATLTLYLTLHGVQRVSRNLLVPQDPGATVVLMHEAVTRQGADRHPGATDGASCRAACQAAQGAGRACLTGLPRAGRARRGEGGQGARHRDEQHQQARRDGARAPHQHPEAVGADGAPPAHRPLPCAGPAG